MTVYLDLLFCCNLAVHFCLLLSTAAICAIRVHKIRFLLGCMLGSLYSLAIFLQLDAVFFLLLKAFMAVTLLLLSFGYGGIRQFLLRLCCFLAVNAVYAGVMMAITLTAPPKGMIYQSGVAYFGSNVGLYAAGLLVGYGVIKGFTLMRKKQENAVYHKVLIRCNGKSEAFTAFCDSGNRLCDLYSGRGVMILSMDAATKLLPKELCADLAAGEFSERVKDFGHGARVLPLSTVNASGMTVVFLPDELTVGEKAHCDLMIGVAKGRLMSDAQAILPASF